MEIINILVTVILAFAGGGGGCVLFFKIYRRKLVAETKQSEVQATQTELGNNDIIMRQCQEFMQMCETRIDEIQKHACYKQNCEERVQ